MPRAAKRPCSYPGCGVLVEGSRCDAHRHAEKREHDAMRPSAARRGYGRRWQAASKGFLRQHPLCQCEECDEGRLRVLPADVVDHHVPHRGDMKLFWDRANWRAMNHVCHNKKTAKEDGAFGNAQAQHAPPGEPEIGLA